MNHSDSDIEQILMDLRFGDFVVKDHARRRMLERGVEILDIQEVGHNCHRWKRQANGRYEVTGKDLDGDRLDLLCVFDGDTVIITVLERD